MTIKHILTIILGAILLQSCNYSGTRTRLNEALQAAGSNRAELESVLQHYADDTLKLKAAEFLISNMPWHYSYADTAYISNCYNSIDSIVLAMSGATSPAITDSISALYKLLHIDTCSIISDIRIINADFLIKNIDEAFCQWRENPWNENISFDDFCEFILPYKSSDLQELAPWRKKYSILSVDSIHSLMSCSLFRISSLRIAEATNNCLMQKYHIGEISSALPQLLYRPETRLKIPFGTCDEICTPSINMFRASGVPIVNDYVPVWGYGNRGHSWATIIAPNGKEISFAPLFTSPETHHKVNETVAKAYRKTYAVNNELIQLNNSGTYVPTVFRNVCQKDVTEKYTDTRDITFSAPNGSYRYMYLCSPSRDTWKPIAFGQVKSGKVTFSNMGKGCIYMMVWYDGVV